MKTEEALIQMDNDWDTDYIFEIFFSHFHVYTYLHI